VREAAAALARLSSGLLVLRTGTRTVALVGVAEELDPFAEALVAAAGRAGLVLVAGPPELASRLAAYGPVALKWPMGTVLTRDQLETARDGRPYPRPN
jgi:hypothetical protein